MPDVARAPVFRFAIIAPGGSTTLNFGAAMGACYIRSRIGAAAAATIVYFNFGAVLPPAAPSSTGFGLTPGEAVNLDDVEFLDLSFAADAGAGGAIVEVIAFPRPGSSGAGVQ